MAAKWVYIFGDGAADGNADMRNLLGGKGANLAEMARLGLPVPPGLTITTEVCAYYYAHDRRYPTGLVEHVSDALAQIGGMVGARFGDTKQPLLVSVRSGGRASMPGMMDTVLNLGLNDVTVEAVASSTGDARFAYDSYRRFIQMYADVVMGLAHEEFEEILDDYKADRDYQLDTDMRAEDWREIVGQYLELVEEALETPFPQDPMDQLWGAIGAVFGSWMNQRAITYRRLHDIPVSWGTAVNIQAMVFGNRGESSATGVAFTRNPASGENELYGEFLVNAQGEDVVAGIRTPHDISEKSRIAAGSDKASLEKLMPQAYAELLRIHGLLEHHYRDMQDIEFTIQEGKLWILQTRAGKRTTAAALKIAVDMAEAGLITQAEAVCRIQPAAIDQLLHPTLDPEAPRELLAAGLPASPGAACGEIVFDADAAEAISNLGRSVILVRTETSPEDIHGMHAAVGILTARGGMTSHAAVVARGMGRPCVSGAGALRIDYAKGVLSCAGKSLSAGDIVTIDGSSGQVFVGEVAMRHPELSDEFSTLMSWADQMRRLKVRANADTAQDAATARGFGAEGIGLARTEHMFFNENGIVAVREMILSADEAGRRRALDKLLVMQRDDFVALFAAMAPFPVTVRLLDPPLHEFLPTSDNELRDVSEAMGVGIEELRARAEALHEFNPMLGHRGCRLAITYPEIAEMQARAIFEAVCETHRQGSSEVALEIMIPLVAARTEFDYLATRIRQVARQVETEQETNIRYKLGTMVELPRACVRAGDIAGGEDGAEFFSFGTNDLTQTSLGISRDDAGRFLSDYVAKGILPADPFTIVDIDGVGALVEMAVARGRAARPDLKLGICGEHGGDPSSVAYFDEIGLDYVSCSPFRVPLARLAAAQSAARQRPRKDSAA